MHVLDALERFVLQLEADGRSRHTIGQYRRHMRAFVAWLAAEGLSRDVESIDHEIVARFLASGAARQRTDGTEKKAASVNALRTSTRVFCSYLHRAGYVAEDPARLVRRAQCGPPPSRGLSDAEEARLLAAARAVRGPEGERDLVLVEFALATGVRLSSALDLHLDDLDLDEGVAVLRRAKGDRAQRIWLGRTIRRRLADYLGDRTEGPVFAARHGRHLCPRNFQRRFRALRDAAGLPATVTPHSLRHRFATRLYEQSGDVLVVKEALGHASVTSSVVYARAGEDRVRRFLAD